MAYARLDFKWDGFPPAVCGEFERNVNAGLVVNRRLVAYSVPASGTAAKGERG